MHRIPNTPGRQSERRGFSLLELLMIVLISALMVGIFVPVAGSVQKRMSLTNAKNTMVFLAARARSHAANRGAIAILDIDPANNRAWIRLRGDTLADSFVDFERDHEADLLLTDPYSGAPAEVGESGVLSICYSPRGYAQQGCIDVPRLPLRLRFTRGGKSDSVEIRALGQIEVFE